MQQKKRNIISTSIHSVAFIGSFGLMMGASILAGYFIGKYVDRKLGTEPWFMLVFLILFIVGAFIKFIQATNEISEKRTKLK